MIIAPSLALWGDKKEWTKEELVNQLKPMCKLMCAYVLLSCLFNCYLCSLVFSEDDPDATKDIEISVS